MECWPCQDVTAVLNISNIEEKSVKSGSGSPFVTRVGFYQIYTILK